MQPVPVVSSDPPILNPPPPIYSSRCGDVTGNGVVDQDDLDLVMAHLGNSNCPLLDVNRDGVVDTLDVGVITSNLGRCLGDLIQNGVVNSQDVTEFNNFWTFTGTVNSSDPGYNAYYDVNCDGWINLDDQLVIVNNSGPCGQ